MAFTTWLWFLWLEILLSLSPGPAVLFVIAQGLRHGGGRSLWASAGILAANTFYFALSAIGLGAVLATMPRLFEVVKWAGVVYLLWLAARALRSRAPVAGPAIEQPPVRGRELLRRGFLLQIANPKALLFFAAILPPFVDLRSPPAWPPWLQVLVLGVTSVGSEFWVLLGYGCLAGAAATRVRSPTFVHWLDRVSGLLLLAVAVWVALR